MSEAVVVNIMGDIRPEQFSEVMVSLDVDAGGVDEIEITEEDGEYTANTQG